MISKQQGLTVTKPPALPPHANIAIGGTAGAGKTALIGTAGENARILVLDTEGGTSTYSGSTFQGIKGAVKTENIDVIQFDEFREEKTTLTVADLVHKVEGVFEHLIRTKNSDKYDVVAVDSLTELQALFFHLHPAKTGWDRYSQWKDALYVLLHKARMVPTNTVFTGRLVSREDETLGRTLVQMDVSPAAWSLVSGLFDVIGYMDVKKVGIGNNAKVVRTLDTTVNMRTVGKDRFGIGELPDPTFSQVLSTIRGGK